MSSYSKKINSPSRFNINSNFLNYARVEANHMSKITERKPENEDYFLLNTVYAEKELYKKRNQYYNPRIDLSRI